MSTQPDRPHPEYAALIEKIRENFDDAAPRLIASDWIEEHNYDGRWNGRAEFIRQQAYPHTDTGIDACERVTCHANWTDVPLVWYEKERNHPKMKSRQGIHWPDDPIANANLLVPPVWHFLTGYSGTLRAEWHRGFVTDLYIAALPRPANRVGLIDDTSLASWLSLTDFLYYILPWHPVQRIINYYFLKVPMERSPEGRWQTIGLGYRKLDLPEEIAQLPATTSMQDLEKAVIHWALLKAVPGVKLC